MIQRIGVIGGGAWGTALAQVCADGGETLLWAREPEVVESINRRHVNDAFLPGILLNQAIRATGELHELNDCDALLVVTPAQHMRTVLAVLPLTGKPLLLCAKGIEEKSGKLMHEVARDEQPGSPCAILSGPTFADEVAAGLPTALTLAADDAALGEALCARLARPTFRPYLSNDIAGTQIGHHFRRRRYAQLHILVRVDAMLGQVIAQQKIVHRILERDGELEALPLLRITLVLVLDV